MTPEELFIEYANGHGKHRDHGNFLSDLYAFAKERYGLSREEMERARVKLEGLGKIRPQTNGTSYTLVVVSKENSPPTKDIGDVPE